MVRLEFSIEIERSVEDIYDVVGNPENDVKWQDAVMEVHKLTPGPIQAGSRYRHTLKIFGKRMGVDVEFIERQPHSGYVLQCRSTPFDFETRVQLTPLKRQEGRSTRLDTIVEGRPTGAARVAAVVLSRHRSAEIDRDLRTLKRLMESGKL
jgi:Polyketide cyclase / dehydrase and lipid transport